MKKGKKMRKKKREGENRAWRERKNKRKRVYIPGVPTVESR